MRGSVTCKRECWLEAKSYQMAFYLRLDGLFDNSRPCFSLPAPEIQRD